MLRAHRGVRADELLERLHLLQQQAGERLDVRARALEGGVELREYAVLPPVGELLVGSGSGQG